MSTGFETAAVLFVAVVACVVYLARSHPSENKNHNQLWLGATVAGYLLSFVLLGFYTTLPWTKWPHACGYTPTQDHLTIVMAAVYIAALISAIAGAFGAFGYRKWFAILAGSTPVLFLVWLNLTVFTHCRPFS